MLPYRHELNFPLCNVTYLGVNYVKTVYEAQTEVEFLKSEFVKYTPVCIVKLGPTKPELM